MPRRQACACEGGCLEEIHIYRPNDKVPWLVGKGVETYGSSQIEEEARGIAHRLWSKMTKAGQAVKVVQIDGTMRRTVTF